MFKHTSFLITALTVVLSLAMPATVNATGEPKSNRFWWPE
jgi:hypothetical protein